MEFSNDNDREGEGTSGNGDYSEIKWLINLRWIALVGQAVTLILAELFLSLDFYKPGLFVGLALTVMINLFLLTRFRKKTKHSTRVMASVLYGDVLILTLILFSSGGAHNPFTSFYLLQIVVGAIILPRSGAFGLIGLAFMSLACLYISDRFYHSSSDHDHDQHHISSITITHDLHVQGMVVALVLTGFFVVVSVSQLKDILKRRNLQLKKHQEQINRQQYFTSMAVMATGAAHELATPLSTIAVVSKELETFLDDSSLDDGSAMDDVRLIRSEVDRCRLIIDRLNPEKTVKDEPVQLDIAETIKKISASLPAHFSKRLNVNVTEECKYILSSKYGLEQSLTILIKNACEADSSDRDVSINVEADHDHIHFMVVNFGSPIGPDVIERMGEPFFTTKSPGKGLGLGLFIVKMFTERFQGNLKIESLPDSPTRVTISLPLTRD